MVLLHHRKNQTVSKKKYAGDDMYRRLLLKKRMSESGFTGLMDFQDYKTLKMFLSRITSECSAC